MSKMKHNVKEGEFFVCSWGWEQTNIDFYQVVGLTPTRVKLRQVKNKVVESSQGGYSTMVVPEKDDFKNDKVLSKQVKEWDDDTIVKLEHSIGKKWNGLPKNATSYA